MDTSQEKYIFRPYGTLVIGGNLFYQYTVPMGLSRRDNILVESKIHLGESPVETKYN
jgi:hypothetical protein